MSYSTARSLQSSSNFFFFVFMHILFLFGRAFNFDSRILILPPSCIFCPKVQITVFRVCTFFFGDGLFRGISIFKTAYSRTFFPFFGLIPDQKMHFLHVFFLFFFDTLRSVFRAKKNNVKKWHYSTN